VRHRQGIIGYRPDTPRTPKPPGRMTLAARRKARHAAPYAAGLTVALAVAVLLHSLAPFWVTIGLVAMHAGLRLLEAVDIRRNGGRRAARQRRRFQGIASEWELRSLSLCAARRRAKVTRPQTGGRLPAHEAGVHIGRSGWLRRRLAVTHEDAVTVIGPPRSGKSAAVGNWIWDAAGAVLVTSTRPDLYVNTAVPRRDRGPVLFLNPAGDGGVPSTLRWSPLDGCETAAGAITAAGYLMAAAPQDHGKESSYWIQRAHTLLRLYMHAAILGGATIGEVRGWITNPANHEPLAILDNHPLAAPGWADELAVILLGDGDPETQQSDQGTALSALAWLADPAMTEAACASPSEWVDVEAFIEGSEQHGPGTVYLIGADRPHNSLAPFFAAFTGHVFETAKRLAAGSPGHRLDPPLTLALDEAAIICPVPLDRWSAEAGGHGITLLAAVQSPSQLKARWGEHGADTIWNNTSKLIFGGLSLARDLDDISKACGEHDTWEWAKDPGTGKKRRQPSAPRPTVLPERIRKMAPGTALFLHRGVRPFFTHLTPVWDRPGYTPATVHPRTAPLAPLDGAVMAPAVPGHLAPAALSQRDPIDAAAAPTRAAAVPAAIPLEEDPHGR